MGRERTILSQYKTHFNFFIETLKKQNWNDYPVSKFETYHISLILDTMQNSKGKSNNFFNHHLKNCKVFFKLLVRKFIIVTYLKVLYHTSIRPKLKCGMINKERWIFILPKEITKNDKKGVVVIPEDPKCEFGS